MATLEISEQLAAKLQQLAERDQRSVEQVLMTLLARYNLSTDEPKTHSLLELEGLGAHLWEGIDAQEYVNELRREWDDRP